LPCSSNLPRSYHDSSNAPGDEFNTSVSLPQPIDFRKALWGLSAIIECELGHNPFAGHLYAFTNKQRNKIKCLFWENNGFVLYYKSLEEDKFIWPSTHATTSQF
jgi:transposase